MDELFETLTLIQTGKLHAFPCVALGRAFWRPLLDVALERLYDAGTITPGEVELQLVDSAAEAVEVIAATCGPPVPRRAGEGA
jgi:hypothetical protein